MFPIYGVHALPNCCMWIFVCVCVRVCEFTVICWFKHILIIKEME